METQRHTIDIYTHTHTLEVGDTTTPTTKISPESDYPNSASGGTNYGKKPQTAPVPSSGNNGKPTKNAPKQQKQPSYPNSSARAQQKHAFFSTDPTNTTAQTSLC
jgi:hypothetical protein